MQLKNMKPSMLIYLLLVSLLVHQAQGGGRKLLTRTTQSSTISSNTTKNEKKELSKIADKMKVQPYVKKVAVKRKMENVVSVDLSPTINENPHPDIVDIADMDYSPAVRKPPVHN